MSSIVPCTDWLRLYKCLLWNREEEGVEGTADERTDDFHQVLLDFCNNVHNQDPINRWRKGCLLPIPKKGNLAITKNYRGITLTAIPAKIYNLMLLNRIRPKIDPVLKKKPKRVPHKPINLGTNTHHQTYLGRHKI